MNSMKLKIHNNPDQTFYAVKDNGDNSYQIEDTGPRIRESEDFNNDDLEFWAEEKELLDDDDYYLEDGSLNFDSLRAAKQYEEDEHPSDHDLPSGRAFLYFEGIAIPEEINIEFIEGFHPGDNSVAVIAPNYQALVELQQYLEKIGEKINFQVKQ